MLHIHSPGVATLEHLHHHHHQQHQQQEQRDTSDSSANHSVVDDPSTGSRLTVSAAGTQTQTSTCSRSTVAAAAETTGSSATVPQCSPTPTNLCPPLYPVYPPYIVMGISVQPFTYPPPQSDLTGAPGVVAGNRKRPGSKLLPPEVKRRSRKQQRRQHGDVVSSTTPDYSLLETTSGSHFPPAKEAEMTSPLCLAVSREDKLVYDSCGALDLTVRK